MFQTASTSTSTLCEECNVQVPEHALAGHRRSLQHRENCCVRMEDGVQIVNTAYRSRIISYRISPQNDHINYDDFFDELKNKILNLLQMQIAEHKSVKVNLELFATFAHQKLEKIEIKSFNTRNEIVNESSVLEQIYDRFTEIMKAKGTEFQERDSGTKYFLL